MLALTRRIGEKLFIGNDVVLTIVDIRGDSVKIAIEAPKQVKIYRGELYEAIIKENKEAADPDGSKVDLLKQIPQQKK